MQMQALVNGLESWDDEDELDADTAYPQIKDDINMSLARFKEILQELSDKEDARIEYISASGEIMLVKPLHS